MIQNTFFQKLLICMFSGLAAAGALWVFRHVVHQALWEMSDDGVKVMKKQQQAAQKANPSVVR
jgi:hypothetical protein